MTLQGKILLWSANIWTFSDALLGPLFAIYAGRIGGDIFEITWAYAIYLIVTGIVVVIVGKISDEFLSKELLLTIGYGLTTLGTLSYLFVTSPIQLFAVQALLGFALALSNPTWYALYSEYSASGHDGYFWGLADGIGKILAGTAVVLGGVIVSYFSFAALFVLMAVLFFLATLYQARLLFLPRTHKYAVNRTTQTS